MNANLERLAKIELTRPDLSDLESRYVLQALESGRLGGGERFTQLVAGELIDTLGCPGVVLTTSGTDALELAAMLLNVGPGDAVVLPSFTFASVATAFARTGASLRFADIEPATLGLDPESLSSLMDSRVKAVVPVHYAGVACDLLGIQSVIRKFENAHLIEDNAHGLFGEFQGRALGTFGPLGATSFHATKNLVTGEGGALLINDPSMAKRAQVLADKGTDRHEFVLGLVDKYTWRDVGSSFILAEPLAAILWGQLQRRNEIHGRREVLYNRYLDNLASRTLSGIQLPSDREGCKPVRHLFYVLCESAAQRDLLSKELHSVGIGATFHYVPLHSAPAAKTFTDADFHCPVADDVSQRLLRLPLHSQMSEADVDRVCGALAESVSQ